MDNAKVEHLELISIKLQKIKEVNAIVEDMRWLTDELRKAWVEMGKMRKQCEHDNARITLGGRWQCMECGAILDERP